MAVSCVVGLAVSNFFLIEFYNDDPRDPFLIGRLLQKAIALPALFALQPWLHWLRVVGFTLLFWIPCFAVTFVSVFFFVGAPAGTAGGGFQVITYGLIAFALAVAWMLAWQLSGRRGSRRVRG
jgi:hypothetical protein